jgi:hypothetical protein
MLITVDYFLTTAISEAGVKTLKAALQAVRERQVEIIPIWTVSHNAAETIAHATKELDVDHRSDRSDPPFGLLPYASRPCAQRANEETSAKLPLDDLQLVSCNRGSQ